MVTSSLTNCFLPSQITPTRPQSSRAVATQLRTAEKEGAVLASQLKLAQDQNIHLRERISGYQTRHRNEVRRISRAHAVVAHLRTKARMYRNVEKTIKKAGQERDKATREEARTKAAADTALVRIGDVNVRLRQDLQSRMRQIRLLRQQCARLTLRMTKGIEKAKLRPLTFRLKQKGVYTSQARGLARLLVGAGCAQSKVGTMIQLFGRSLGLSVPERMTRRTVRRVFYEAEVARRIQLGYELKHTSSMSLYILWTYLLIPLICDILVGFTISGDATTDRHVNYEARFALVRAPEHYSPSRSYSDSTLVPQNRFVGIESSVDHTSETQVVGWHGAFNGAAEAFNLSPLAKRDGALLDVIKLAVKLKGVGGDHAADQLKTARLLAAWKTDMTCTLLGRDHLGYGGQPTADMLSLIEDTTAASVRAVGGCTNWAIMSAEQRSAIYVDQLNRAIAQIGRALYEGLPDQERRPLDLFLRLGCAMHKDLNSVKGGAAAMANVWADLDAPPPVLLANKDNASTLQDVDLDTLSAASLLLSDSLSPAEMRALEASTRGGVKLCSLAGAIFNNKDDKKGQHDTYVYYFEHFLKRRCARFPDTSNTRYQSYCEAAAELLINRIHYIEFLELVRDHKAQPGFTNIEQNVYNGLHDPSTLSELAVLAVYAQAVTHPYMRTARVRQNGLKLGPLHVQLKTHIAKLIANPDLLIGPEACFVTGAMDGLIWHRPEVLSTVRTMAPDLPHLKPLLVGFLTGALQTWGKFTIEFAQGGAIDTASEAELEAAYILPTNDHNEGALGALRVWKRLHPNGSLTYFNAQKGLQLNGTAEFIEVHLNSEEDQAYLRAAARALDASGDEAERRRKLIKRALAAAAERVREREEKRRKDEEEIARLRTVRKVFAAVELRTLKNAQLDEQLLIYRRLYNDTKMPYKSHIPNKPQKLAALLEAIQRNEPGQLDITYFLELNLVIPVLTS